MIRDWNEDDDGIAPSGVARVFQQAQMKTEAKGQLYDILIALGQQTLEHYNPCDWRNGKCRRMRSQEDDQGCCVGCRHLGPEGCTATSLGCKLWLCEGQRDLFRECEIELKVLRQVADSCGILYEIRRLKEEDLTLYNFQPYP